MKFVTSITFKSSDSAYAKKPLFPFLIVKRNHTSYFFSYEKCPSLSRVEIQMQTSSTTIYYENILKKLKLKKEL